MIQIYTVYLDSFTGALCADINAYLFLLEIPSQMHLSIMFVFFIATSHGCLLVIL